MTPDKQLTANDRLDMIAEILAVAILRGRNKTREGLDLSPKQSVHGDHNKSRPNADK